MEVLTGKENYQAHPLEQELYRTYRPDFQLLQKIKDFEKVDQEARHQFWEQVTILCQQLDQAQSIFDRNKTPVAEIKTHYDPVTAFRKLVESLQSERQSSSHLDKHLAQVAAYMGVLRRSINTQLAAPLDAQKLELLEEIVAPLHDSIKPLGARTALISLDHQVVMQHILNTYHHFFGLDTSQGQFCAAIAGDHENSSTQSRTNLLASLSHESSPEETAIVHAKVLFYFADTFTDVLQALGQDDVKELSIDPQAMDDRLGDIILRWNDPAITPNIDPSWALSAYEDFVTALDLLHKSYALAIPLDDAKSIAIESITAAFTQLMQVFDARKYEQSMQSYLPNNHKPLPTADRSEFETVLQRLQEIRAREQQNQRDASLDLLSSRLEILMKSLYGDDHLDQSFGKTVPLTLQTLYQASETPGEFAPHITQDEYDHIKGEYQAFHVVAINAAINFFYYYLQSTQHQERMLQLCNTMTGDESAQAIMQEPILRQITQDLAAHLHNIYQLTVEGDNSDLLWTSLGHAKEGRDKRAKSMLLATQLVRSVIQSLRSAQNEEIAILNQTDRDYLQKINFQTTENDISHLFETMNEVGLVEKVARANHGFWLKAKQVRGDDDMQSDLNPTLPFDELSPLLQNKNRLGAMLSLSMLKEELSKLSDMESPLELLTQLATHLFAIIKTSDNSDIRREAERNQPELKHLADLLTSRQYGYWLSHKLIVEKNGTRTGELQDANIFSMWASQREQNLYAKVPGGGSSETLHVSVKDLDRLPLLIGCITLYEEYRQVIAKDPPERQTIVAIATALGMTELLTSNP